MRSVRLLGAFLMALAITHTTTADATFSASGAAAWDEAHTVSGLAAVATSGAYADLSGAPAIITLADVYPVGSVYISTSATDPATTFGFGTWLLTSKGQALTGFLTGDADFGTGGATGGAKTVSASGTVSAPTFSGDAYTPSGALDLTLYIAKGTNEAAAFTPSGALTWPTGVPTFQGTSVQAAASVNWPVGVPTFAGTAHQHQLPMYSTGATSISFLPTSAFGVGTSRAAIWRISASASGPVVQATVATGQVYLSQSVSAAGVISWPASVPQAVGSSSAAGIISWPATAPSFAGGAGTVPAQVFSGTVGSGSGVFTGVGKAPTGSISQPVFTGDQTSVLQPYMVFYIWERTA